MSVRAPASCAGSASNASAPASQTARLPNGLLLRCVSKRDVPFLYQEIYERRCYLRHGIQLPPGGTVIDCGSNIGLLSMLAAEELGPEGLVIACEPMPRTFDCLEHNAATHRRWWQQEGQQRSSAHDMQLAKQQVRQLVLAGAAIGEPAAEGGRQQLSSAREEPLEVSAGSAGLGRIIALNVGVGSGQQPYAEFIFYPRAAGWSSMRPAEGEVAADMGAFLEQALSSQEAAAAAGIDPTTAAIGRWLRCYAPRWLYTAVWRGAVAHMLGGAQHVRSPLLSVSQLISRYRLEVVDLLKVDCERAELEVLQGVEDCHWPLVRQAALEVHAADLEEVLQLLRHRAGFSTIVVEQEAALAGTSLHAVYCRR